MNGRRIGSVSLRLDAVYCVGAAVIVASCAHLISSQLQVSSVTILLAASATVIWGAFLWLASNRFLLRPVLLVVMSANILAAAGIAVLAIALPDMVLSLLAAAVSVEVAAFAASQAVALRAR